MTTPFDPAKCVTDQGVFMPRLDEVLAWLQDEYRTIYGSGIDLDPESPDGQVVGIEAEAMTDHGQLIQLTYNALASPNNAKGSILGNICLLNGVTRRPGEYTIAPITIEGKAGSSVGTGFIIRNKVNGKLFSPTGTITIAQGQTTATGYAACREKGNIEALAGDLTQIITVTSGIVAVTNDLGAVGCYTEDDAALRARRYQSVALPSQGMTDGLQAALINMAGVKQAIVWENDEDVAVDIGQTGTLDPHCIYVLCDVTAGGDLDPDRNPAPDPDLIATTIFNRKAGGCSTMGTVARTVTDSQGKDHVIRYEKPTPVDVYVEINLTKRYGWPNDGEDQIEQNIAAWAADTDDDGNRHITIGGNSNNELSWTDVLSAFVGKVGGFNLTSMKLGTTLGGGVAGANLPIDFNEIAQIHTVTVNAT